MHGGWEGTLWQKRKDKGEFLAHIAMRAIKDEGGQLIAFSHVTNDITVQKQHEDTLRDQAQQFRVMTEALPGWRRLERELQALKNHGEPTTAPCISEKPGCDEQH